MASTLKLRLNFKQILAVLAISVIAILFIWQYTVLNPKRNFLITRNITAQPLEQRIMLAWNNLYGQKWWFWAHKHKGKRYVMKKCGNYKCVLTTNKNKLNKSDMVLFHLRDPIPPFPPYRLPNQPWVLTIVESPINTYGADSARLQNVFNRSISYRTDSDVYLGSGWMTKKMEKPKNSKEIPKVALGKKKLVTWFVSNCDAEERMEYASKLKKYVPIDIFGNCGKKDPCKYERNCTMKMRQKYKFCLGFENSRCRDYITEKYWFNAIAGCVPIVLGPSIENYNKMVPPDSFLHVDNFTSPKKLASYIKYLDHNDEAYFKYHMWRHKYDIFDRPQVSLCDFCSVLDAKPHKAYNLSEFWGREHNCD